MEWFWDKKIAHFRQVRMRIVGGSGLESSVTKPAATSIVLFCVWCGNFYIASVLEIPADHKSLLLSRKLKFIAAVHTR